MSGKGKSGVHNPSRYRSIKRALKGGEDQKELLKTARSIHDPYYASKALTDIGVKGDLEKGRAVQILEEALKTLEKVDKPWRRAEILGYLCKAISNWSNQGARKGLWKKVLKTINGFPRGKPRSKAIDACSNYTEPGQLVNVLEIALKNPGQELGDGKNVLRAWALSSPGEVDNALLEALNTLTNDKLRAKLLGYLYLQAGKVNVPCPQSVLEDAVRSALKLEGGSRLEALRYLAYEAASDIKDLKIIHDALGGLENHEVEARILATLGARADELGQGERAVKWFEEGLERAEGIEGEKKRSKVMLNLAKGLALCGEKEGAKTVMKKVDGELRKATGIAEKLKDLEGELDISAPKKVEKDKGDEKNVKRISTAGPRPVLALYNTYQGGLKQVHLRAVARSAPLCWAFGLDLALIGFPGGDTENLVSRTIEETNIGKGGKYLRRMAATGDLFILGKGTEAFEEWNRTGMPAATTSHPDRKKAANMSTILGKALRHPAKRPLIIMGLGRKGIPAPVLSKVKYHLELTGGGIPLETCTAMGVIAQQVAYVMQKR